MNQIRDEVSAQAKPFGIDVVDVRIRRADLPAQNSQAIYARMRSEREQQAAQYRGEGAEAAQNVRANAERERTVILAEAQRDAQRVRGDGDAQSIRIYADAFGKDKQFFAFYRSMQAYRDASDRTRNIVCADARQRVLPLLRKSGRGGGQDRRPDGKTRSAVTQSHAPAMIGGCGRCRAQR